MLDAPLEQARRADGGGATNDRGTVEAGILVNAAGRGRTASPRSPKFQE
jgi:hypothetical protein